MKFCAWSSDRNTPFPLGYRSMPMLWALWSWPTGRCITLCRISSDSLPFPQNFNDTTCIVHPVGWTPHLGLRFLPVCYTQVRIIVAFWQYIWRTACCSMSLCVVSVVLQAVWSRLSVWSWPGQTKLPYVQGMVCCTIQYGNTAHLSDETLCSRMSYLHSLPFTLCACVKTADDHNCCFLFFF